MEQTDGRCGVPLVGIASADFARQRAACGRGFVGTRRWQRSAPLLTTVLLFAPIWTLGCGSPSQPSSSRASAAASSVRAAPAPATPTAITRRTPAPGELLFTGPDITTVVPVRWLNRTADAGWVSENGFPSQDRVELSLEGPQHGHGETVAAVFVVQFPADQYSSQDEFAADLTAPNPGVSVTTQDPTVPLSVGGELALSITFSGSVGSRTLKELTVVVDHHATTYEIIFITSPGAFAAELPVAMRVISGLTWNT